MLQGPLKVSSNSNPSGGPPPAGGPARRPGALERTGDEAWNYRMFVADGAAYFGGVAFVAQDSVLPTLIADLGGPAWLVALMPASTIFGFTLSAPLLAHKVERMRRFRPLLAPVALFQRLPALAAALGLLVVHPFLPAATLWITALMPFLTGFIGGLLVTAFWELFTKSIPPGRRASNAAWRYIGGALIGLGAGQLISWILGHFPGPRGYGILFLCQFVLLMASYAFFMAIRERTDSTPSRTAASGLLENFRGMPALFRAQPAAFHYLIGRILGVGGMVLIPFLALHFREALGLPMAFVGQLVTAQTAGLIAGNLVAGWTGDRYGGKLPMMAGRFLMVGVCAGAAFAASPAAALAVFFGLGLAGNLAMVGDMTLQLEIFPAERRPTMIALQSLLMLPAQLAAAGVAALLHASGTGIFWNAVAAGGFQILSIAVFWPLREPRPRPTLTTPATT